MLCAVVWFGLGGCAHQETSPEDAEGIYQEAEELLKDERYLLAIDKYRDIKNRFPYHRRALDSELRVADTYFEMESYLEAESAYEIFRELHPVHPRADYVQYRIALSYFRMIPSDTARDLSAAYRAIDSFQTLVTKFPNSSHAAEATKAIETCNRKLAEHELYVATFYFTRDHFLPASFRYAGVLQQYGSLGYDEEALFRLGESFYKVRMFINAKDAYSRLLSSFPKSAFADTARQRLEKLASY